MPHILLVDDEPSQRQSFRKTLESHDFKVAEATSVLEAEGKFSLSDFDLIVTELRLPGVAGSDLIKLSRTGPRHRDDKLRQSALGDRLDEARGR